MADEVSTRGNPRESSINVPVELLLPKIADDVLLLLSLAAVVSADPVLVVAVRKEWHTIWAELGVVEEDVERELENLGRRVRRRSRDRRVRQALREMNQRVS